MRPSFLINTVRTGWPEDESGMGHRTNSLTSSQGGCIRFACRLSPKLMWTLSEEWGIILSLLALHFDFGLPG